MREVSNEPPFSAMRPAMSFIHGGAFGNLAGCEVGGRRIGVVLHPPVVKKAEIGSQAPLVGIRGDSAFDELDGEICAARAHRTRFREKNRAKAISWHEMRIKGRGEIEQRPQQIEVRAGRGDSRSVVLHRARPVDVGEQRVIAQAQLLGGWSGAEEQLLFGLPERARLRVDAHL